MIYVSLDGRGFSVYRFQGSTPTRVAGPFSTSTAAWRAADSFARTHLRYPIRQPMAEATAQALYQTGYLLSPIGRDVWEESCSSSSLSSD